MTMPTANGAQARLSTIAEITGRLSRSLDFGQALQELIEAATELLGVERGAVLLLDHRTRSLSIAAARGFGQDEVRSTRVQVGFGIVGAVAETGRPLIQKRRPTAGSVADIDRPDTGLCVPMAVHGKLLGVMSFETRKAATRFLETDVEFAKLIADQAALSLYSDLLHKEFQDGIARAETPPAERQMAAA